MWMSHCTGTNPANLWRNRSLRFAPCRSSPTVCARSEGWGVAKGFRRSCQRAQTLCKVRTYASWSAHDPARTARGRGPTLPPSTRKLGHPRCAARHPAARGPGGMEPPGARRHALHRPAAASPELAASCPSSSSPTPPAAAISVPAAPRTARTARTPVSAAGRACVPRNRSREPRRTRSHGGRTGVGARATVRRHRRVDPADGKPRPCCCRAAVAR